MQDLTGDFDVAVVGGGLSGLTAASLAARAGMRVVVLERSRNLGGRAVTHVDQGYHFNLGPHAWYVGGPGTQVLTDLGVPLPGRAPKASGVYGLIDGRLHALPVGFISLLSTSLLTARGKIETARLLASLPRLESSAYDDQPLSTWLSEHVHDPTARQVIEMFIRVATYTNASDLLSAGAGLAWLQTALKHNVRYVDGGWQTIVDALEARALSLGTRMITGAPVAEVIHDTAVRGVRLQNGGVVRAANVVLAGSPSMVRQMVPNAPASARRKWSPVPSRAACLDLALATLPRPSNLVAFGVDRPLYYSVHSAVAALAPAGGALVHVSKYLDPQQPQDARRDEQELEAFVDRLQPGWRDVVVTRRYLPAMTVTGGIPTAADAGLRGRASVEVDDIPGLYIAGDWTGHEGMLASASVASAAQAARLISKRVEHVEAVA